MKLEGGLANREKKICTSNGSSLYVMGLVTMAPFLSHQIMQAISHIMKMKNVWVQYYTKRG